MQAAKAARGHARQQRAEKHSSRLAHQREKAALALAALQALHPYADIREAGNAEAREAGNAEGSIESGPSSRASPAASIEHADTDAARIIHLDSAAPGEVCNGIESTQQQEQCCIPSTATADLSHVHSLPVMPNSPSPPLTSQEMIHPYSHSYVMSEAKPIPLRRHASAAGALNMSKLVPSPLTPGCSAGCQTNSPNSMTSWQIVRPRPVQRDRSTLKASKHVHVQA